MKLNTEEHSMLDGDGKPRAATRQRAMKLLVRYGGALSTEWLVDTNKLAGTVGASPVSIREYSAKEGDGGGVTLNSYFDHDVDETAEQNLLQVIETGDWVMVDTATRTVKFAKEAARD